MARVRPLVTGDQSLDRFSREVSLALETAVGEPGPPGADGARGATGAAGAAGATGSTGATGVSGLSVVNVQYVTPASIGGNDANDGLTWATPKATVHSAWNALSSDGGNIYVQHLSYWNSDPDVGLWVASDMTGLDTAKWLHHKNVHIKGMGLIKNVSLAHRPAALVYGGSRSTRNTPGIWLADTSTKIFIEDIAVDDYLLQPIVLGTRPGNHADRSYTASNFRLENVSASTGSGSLGDHSYNDAGPAIDIGNTFYCDFIDCTFRGRQDSTNPVGTAITACGCVLIENVNTAAVPATSSNQPGMTLTNPTRLLLQGQTTASENGVYTWTGAATPLVRTSDDPLGSIVTISAANTCRYAGTQFVRRASNVWDWTHSTTDRLFAMLAEGDSTGFNARDLILDTNGVRVHSPLFGQYSISIDNCTMDGPLFYAAQNTIELLGASSYGVFAVNNLLTADITNDYDLYVSDSIDSSVVTASCIVQGRVHNCQITGMYPPYAGSLVKSPFTERNNGFVKGKLYAHVDHARRLFGPTVVRSTNLVVSSDPASWVAGVGSVTTGQIGPDGSLFAGKLTSGGYIQLDNTNRTLAVGDYLIVGVWAKKSASDTASSCGTLQLATTGFTCNNGTATSAGVNLHYLGQTEWQWCTGKAVITSIGTNPCGVAMSVNATGSADFTFYGPVYCHLAASTFSENEMNEIFYSLQSYPSTATVGTVTAMPGQTGVLPGHIVSQGATPSAAVGTHVSTSVLVGNDTSGKVTVTVDGTGTAGGVVTTVTFARAFAAAPHVILTPATAAAAAAGVYVTSTTTTFTITTGALAAAASCIWHYMTVQ